MSKPLPLVAGNWKMNGLAASFAEVETLADSILTSNSLEAEVLICPPATLIEGFARKLGDSSIRIGAQDCHESPSGAHTGDIAAQMLAEAGATSVIVGHSERRADHGETNKMVKAKAEAALKAGLTAIVCVGETEAQRKQGETLSIVSDQMRGSLPAGASAETTVVAYEPVWAIGTGLTPTPEDVKEVHGHIRNELIELLGSDTAMQMRILYGGSVKPANAAELMSVDNVNGALVGGASLKADDFWGIIRVYTST